MNHLLTGRLLIAAGFMEVAHGIGMAVYASAVGDWHLVGGAISAFLCGEWVLYIAIKGCRELTDV